MSWKQGVIVGAGLVLGACATQQVPVKQYALAGGRAEYRDYAGERANICDSEPRWLMDELSSMNGLLARFVSSTEQANTPGAAEQAQQMALLKEAAGSLGKVLDVHQSNLKALQGCGFARSGAFPELGRRGLELVEMSRARLAEGNEAKKVEAAQLKWKEEAPQREQTARQTWCAKDPEVGSTDLFYARRFADGRTEWLFCDGHRVQAASASAEPTLVSPEGLSAKDRRKVKPARYLDAAKGYPTEEIDKQPTEPGAPAAAPAQGAATNGQ
ncbi:hypothetical protein [Cystobacter fuscus]|uniref:hypothetical protein n=1 Tax=Cystobacter fuscus TaxID=43 RepID=UPI002B2F979B|nr:hypothetical protein F0U63_39825 [Cystobacter fuscus]